MMWKYLAGMALLITLAFPTSSQALSCIKPSDPPISDYDFAVAGTVTHDKAGKVLMDVEKSWKKKVNTPITFKVDTVWGVDYVVGEKYLVYLDENSSTYVNDPCSPSVPYMDGVDHEESLGDSFQPKSKATLPAWELYRNEMILVVLGGILLSTIAIFVLKGRLKK